MTNGNEARALRIVDEQWELLRSVGSAPCLDEDELLPGDCGQPGEEDDDSTQTSAVPALHAAALHGPLGEFVREVSPQTEADPAALLVQALVAFGSCIGRSAHVRVGADRHYANLFALLVGGTARGRKGLAWSEVRKLFDEIDPQWQLNCVVSGLATGEGLIWAVRDPIERQEPVRKDGRIVSYQNLQTDPGVSDKRLLVVETEFVGVLKVATREGNILSAVIRQAWDTGTLRGMSKSSPARATDAYISAIGHITSEELHRHLGRTEAVNGFANRFLFVSVRRSKLLPEGGQPVDLTRVIAKVRSAVEFARGVGEVSRDRRGRELWIQAYPILTAGRPGLAGSVTARAEAQVLRLSLIYALLDCSATIQRTHIEAALALWAYCDASAAYVLGATPADPFAERVLAALHEHPDGIKKSELNNLFGRHDHGPLAAALTALQELGSAELITVPTRGRPSHLWRATSAPKAPKGGLLALLAQTEGDDRDSE